MRIVAATNRDLKQEVGERRFREDLYYRLHVVPIAVPPLRERREDVLLLADLFLARAAARHGRRAPRIGARALGALAAHSWPGNVRELANVMEAALLLSRDEIDVEHLPGVDVEDPDHPPIADDFARNVGRVLSTYATADAAALPALRDARDAFERAYLDACLAKSIGNVALAARIAGRNRTDFYDLLRRHGISPASFKA